jgi:predicted dehydrogenase
MSRSVSRREFVLSSAGLAAGVSVAAEVRREVIGVQPAWEQTSNAKVRIGVVGGGFGCAFHWHEHPNCIVEAVSDLIPDRRKLLMKVYKCEKSYESLEKLVLDPTVDAVAVFTGAPDHARHVTLCMERGKHVISACPACLTLEEAAQLKEVKERTGLKYMNAETSYYRWGTIAARQLVQDGVLGELVYSEGEYYHPGIGRADHSLSKRDGKHTWRYGYPPMLYPTHSTAFLVGVTRERLVKVSCIGTGDAGEPALKDNQYNNPFLNGMGLFLTDAGHPFRCNVAWDIHAHGERAQWFGTKGAVYLPGSGGQPLTIQIEDRTLDTLPDYWPMVPPKMRRGTGHGRSHPFITNEFVMALVEDREPAIDLYESLAFCVPGIVAHESALKGGEQLDIPQFDPA